MLFCHETKALLIVSTYFVIRFFPIVRRSNCLFSLSRLISEHLRAALPESHSKISDGSRDGARPWLRAFNGSIFWHQKNIFRAWALLLERRSKFWSVTHSGAHPIVIFVGLDNYSVLESRSLLFDKTHEAFHQKLFTFSKDKNFFASQGTILSIFN